MKQRHDHGTRVAGDKAIYPDEFLTRSQVLPGEGIRFDYLGNHDIVINAEGNRSVNGAKVMRTLTAVLVMHAYPDTAFADVDGTHKVVMPTTPVNEEQKHIGFDLGVDFPAIRQHHLFMPEGVRVFHNWNIPKVNAPTGDFSEAAVDDHRCRYLYSVIDASGMNVKESVVRCLLEVLPVDANSVIVRRRNCSGSIYPEGGTGRVNYGSGNISRTRLTVSTDNGHRFNCGSKPFIILNMMEVQ